MRAETTMSHYIHDIPGRLRIRSAALRDRVASALDAQERLLDLDGVRHVRLNTRAGSLTVEYDPARLSRHDILASLDPIGCVPRTDTPKASTGPLSGKAGQLFGKALAGALVNKIAERSALKLVSVLL